MHLNRTALTIYHLAIFCFLFCKHNQWFACIIFFQISPVFCIHSTLHPKLLIQTPYTRIPARMNLVYMQCICFYIENDWRWLYFPPNWVFFLQFFNYMNVALYLFERYCFQIHYSWILAYWNVFSRSFV